MKGTTLTAASHQWATRPDDERYRSPSELHAAVMLDREQSDELPVVTRNQLRVQATPGGGLEWQSCTFTNWSFGQLASLADAPGRYLQGLPAELAADCLNHGLRKIPDRVNSNMNHDDDTGRELVSLPLVRRSPEGKLTLRAMTSELYQRIWNADLTAGLCRLAEQGWINPPAWDDRPSGLYYGDRSLFAFMIEDANRSIVTHPEATRREELGRGFFMWNSEEGALSFGLCLFWFQFVCGNHLVWGAEKVQTIRIRHLGDGLERRIRKALEATVGRALEDRSADFDGIRYAMGARLVDVPLIRGDKKLAEALVPEIGKRSAGRITPGLARRGIERAQKDGLDPRTIWGAVNGLTSVARDEPNADRRREIDLAAVTLMPKAKGAEGQTVWTV